MLLSFQTSKFELIFPFFLSFFSHVFLPYPPGAFKVSFAFLSFPFGTKGTVTRTEKKKELCRNFKSTYKYTINQQFLFLHPQTVDQQRRRRKKRNAIFLNQKTKKTKPEKNKRKKSFKTAQHSPNSCDQKNSFRVSSFSRRKRIKTQNDLDKMEGIKSGHIIHWQPKEKK